ncbi:MAG: ATP-grasp domain-containing protein [Candidatus Obscuribacterales bacterium]|nr:ATP-grasp domain-containing protein [Candidatus Obscuribacterales bacterium]
MTGKVLVVAAGAWQVPLIRFLQTKGHHVSVVDPYDHSPGVAVADAHIKADVRNEEEIFQAIKDLSFEFIVTDQSDISVETSNNLARRFGLPANPPEAVSLFVNKFYSRRFSAQAKMPVPKWECVQTAAELEAALAKIGLPAILKPPDNQASCGIYKIDESNVAKAAELLAASLAQSRQKYVLCEEYVSGEHITVEGYCSKGKHRSFAASTKEHFPSGVIAQLLYPTTVPEDLLAEVFAANDRYVEQSGLKFGITHAEYIVDVPNGRFWLVEIACRGGGTRLSSDIAKWVSGADIYELFYKELHGEHTDLSKLSLQRKAAYLEFFEFGEGFVEKIEGVEAARALPGVLDLNLVFAEGDRIRLAENGRTRQGFFIVFGETHDDVKNKAALVKKTITVKLAQALEVV